MNPSDELGARLIAAADQLDAYARDDKAAKLREWREGPTDDPELDPIRLWREGDIDCAIVRTSFGHLCGYARVPDEHPWAGLAGDDPVPEPRVTLDDMLLEEAFDDFGAVPVFAAALVDGGEELAASLAGQVRVHGGLTFAGPLSHVRGAPHGWWLGFDCAHFGDAPDPRYVPALLRGFARTQVRRGDHVWTVEEVALEVRRLVVAITEAGADGGSAGR